MCRQATGLCAVAFLWLFSITGHALAGEDIIWEYRAGTTGPVYLDPADYPDDPLTKALKRERERLTGEMAVGEMVVVPAGSFRMGDLNGGGDSDEKPVHRVTIPRPFAVGKYEVTQAQWQTVMGYNPSRFKGDNRPVDKVPWDDAQEFIKKLNSMTGKKYRLLSESEWEYAARAGTTTKWSCGNNDRCLNGVAWYSGNKTHPVGQKTPNAFGLYDMHGNVWEWVEDCKDSYNGAPTNGSAKTGKNYCYRVYRGGSWGSDPWFLRSANRNWSAPDIRNINLGLRLARTL